MKFGMHLEYIIICCFFTGTQCTTVERYFKSSQNKTSAPNAGKQITTSMRSRIECAVACREAGCSSFSYDGRSRTCGMSKGIMQTISDRVYCAGSQCPSHLGYREWPTPDMTLCLKYMRSPLDYFHASESCVVDGGHLALIVSNSMRLHVIEILDSLSADPGITYFDGYDVGDQNIFLTSKGDVLPWTSWSGFNPDNRNGEDCIAGERADGYLTRDFHCTKACPFVCQIDI